MIDFAAARRMMVDGQVRTSDVTDLRIIAAMLEVPRERFVPRAQRRSGLSRLDVTSRDRGGEPARRLLKPMVLAKLIQAAEVEPTTGCSMSAAPPATRRRCWRGWRARWWRSRRIRRWPARARGARRGGRGQRDGGDRPLPDGWPPGALRRDLRQRRGRDRARIAAAASSRTAAGWWRWWAAPPRRAMLYRSVDGEVSGRPIFDAAAPLLPGFARRRVRVLDGIPPLFPTAGVARKHQAAVFSQNAGFSPGFQAALQPHYG